MLTPEARSYNMSRIRGTNTKPELKVRKALHSRGLRYRVNVRRLPGSPDIVLSRYRTVIFVNGCFWHGHQGCKLYTRPRTNAEFWRAKVERNQQRDEIDNAKLETMGWYIITIWECQIKADKFDATIEDVIQQLQANQRKWQERREQRRAEREAAQRAKATKAARNEAMLAGLEIPASISRLSEQEQPDASESECYLEDSAK